MVVIVGMFYWISVLRMEDESALWRAADELLTFLEGTGCQNTLIEIANEIDVVIDRTPYDLFTPDRQAEMIIALREQHPGFLYSTSSGGAQVETGRGMPSPALVEADDYVPIHGNGLRPAGVEAAIQAIRAMPAWQAHPKPIVINEDSPAVPTWRCPGGIGSRGAITIKALKGRRTIPGCPTSRARGGIRGPLRS